MNDIATPALAAEDGLTENVIRTWTTTDGKTFDFREDALAHQKGLDKAKNMEIWRESNSDFIKDWLEEVRPDVKNVHRINRLVDLIVRWEHRNG